jgi:Phage integrase, N-terminal SAM-like domain
MRVQRVLMPGSGAESWTVLDDEHSLVEPVERFLGYLASIERSPNTIKAYTHDLKDWFVYLGGVGLDWREVSLEDVAGFVGWLRLPPAARDGRVAVLPTVEHHCSESSVNRKLAALTSFFRRGSESTDEGWAVAEQLQLALPGFGSRLAQTHLLLLECFLKAGQRSRSHAVQLFQLGYRHVGELR